MLCRVVDAFVAEVSKGRGRNAKLVLKLMNYCPVHISNLCMLFIIYVFFFFRFDAFLDELPNSIRDLSQSHVTLRVLVAKMATALQVRLDNLFKDRV